MLKENKIGLANILNIFISFLILFLAIKYNGGSISSFINYPSILLVIIGTIVVTISCFSLSKVVNAYRKIFEVIFYNQVSIESIIRQALELHSFFKKYSIIALENKIDKSNINDIFKKGVILLNQALPIDVIEKLSYQELAIIDDRSEEIISIIRKSAEISPAMGLIGTLIGLVQMLGNLSDPTNLGPSMAIALLTTFYGAVFAYILFFPLATKLEISSREENMINKIFIITLNHIAKSSNKRDLINNLNSFLKTQHQIDI